MFRNPLTDVIVVLVVVLLIFGPKRLPLLGRSLGQGMREFKDSITGENKDSDEEDRPALTSGPGAAAPAEAKAPAPAEATAAAPAEANAAPAEANVAPAEANAAPAEANEAASAPTPERDTADVGSSEPSS